MDHNLPETQPSCFRSRWTRFSGRYIYGHVWLPMIDISIRFYALSYGQIMNRQTPLQNTTLQESRTIWGMTCSVLLGAGRSKCYLCKKPPTPLFCGHINPPIWTTTKSKCSTICGLMPHRQAICVTKVNALSIYKPLSETLSKTSQTAISHVTRCSKHYSTPSIIPRIHFLTPFPEKTPEAMVQSIFVHIVGANWVSNIKGQWDDCHLRGGCPSTPI